MLPAASAGPIFHEAIVSGKFHGVMSPTTPSGSRTVKPTPAGHRDRVAQQALGGRGVVAEGVGHHPHLAARVADRLARVARLEHRELLVVLGERVGEPVQQPGAVARRHRAPGGEGGLGARDRRVDVGGGRALYLGQDLLGGRLDDLQGHRSPA